MAVDYLEKTADLLSKGRRFFNECDVRKSANILGELYNILESVGGFARVNNLSFRKASKLYNDEGVELFQDILKLNIMPSSELFSREIFYKIGAGIR